MAELDRRANLWGCAVNRRIRKPRPPANQTSLIARYLPGDLVRYYHWSPCQVEGSAALDDGIYVRDPDGVLHKAHWWELEPISE